MLHQQQSSTSAIVNTDGTHHTNINFIISTSDGKPPVYWVIDVGATYHITHTLHHFQFHCYITPINMKLPVGNIFVTNIAGSFHISNSIIFSNVYYIPSFHFNLIFVIKFIDSSSRTITFTNKECLNLQKISSRMISLVERYRDIYVLQA